ncbi:hypothetical protein H5410_017656 [Solanum commersonii]|uniref:Uncharacterized protein n=1 Tax=Solanum commersonii TaxID=4109 RepID=A0A9J6A037_SOLCO|nr:hypothetical protein H5410_017656 [Solanum commersonii]
MLAENFNLFYKFNILSLEQSELWHEIQLRGNTFSSLRVKMLLKIIGAMLLEPDIEEYDLRGCNQKNELMIGGISYHLRYRMHQNI